MRIAILALQGAFLEHEQMLQRLGVETFEVRQLADWQQPKDGLVIPGGESTVQSKLLHELGLFEPIQTAIRQGLPVFGTCAGLILLAQHIEGSSQAHLATMQMEVERNAYGRQLGSFHTESRVTGIDHPLPMTFIRAPRIVRALSNECQVLATVDQHIVAARQGNQLVTAFHPELDNDLSIHRYFIDMIKTKATR